jgi:hypothetical protein
MATKRDFVSRCINLFVCALSLAARKGKVLPYPAAPIEIGKLNMLFIENVENLSHVHHPMVWAETCESCFC